MGEMETTTAGQNVTTLRLGEVMTNCADVTFSNNVAKMSTH